MVAPQASRLGWIVGMLLGQQFGWTFGASERDCRCTRVHSSVDSRIRLGGLFNPCTARRIGDRVRSMANRAAALVMQGYLRSCLRCVRLVAQQLPVWMIADAMG